MKLFPVILIMILTYSSAFTQNDDTNFLGLNRTFKPFVEAEASLGIPAHSKLDSIFRSIGSIQLNLGYTELVEHKANILKLDERFLFARYSSSDYNMEVDLKNDNGFVYSEMWQLGIGYRTGFGYDVGPFTLMPYDQYSFIGTDITFNAEDSLSTDEEYYLNRFSGDYRWGTSFGGGVRFSLFRTISGNLGYELTSINPRWTVLPWFGSFAIQTIALGAVSVFGEDIVDSSSLLGPIFYFALKNGLGIMFYELTKVQMYWPFESEPPLTVTSIKLGASISF